MKMMYKRFNKEDGTIRSFDRCSCLCSCDAIGCTIENMELYKDNYNTNKRKTKLFMFNGNRG